VDLDDFGDVLGVAAGENPGNGDFVVPAEGEDSEVAGFEIGVGEVERRGGYRRGLACCWNQPLSSLNQVIHSKP